MVVLGGSAIQSPSFACKSKQVIGPEQEKEERVRPLRNVAAGRNERLGCVEGAARQLPGLGGTCLRPSGLLIATGQLVEHGDVFMKLV